MEKQEKSRSWFCVFNNPQEVYTGEPHEIAEQCLAEWVTGHPTRTGAVAYCVSADGTKHLHMVLEDSQKARFSALKKAYPKAHLEPTKGTKEQAEDYINKRGKHQEKGETVVYVARFGEIKGNQGHRNELDTIGALLQDGLTPNQIYDVNFAFRRYESMIRAEFFRLRKNNTPRLRDIVIKWHVGKPGSGKSFVQINLMEQYGDDEVYLVTDYKNGFDMYNGEKVLFMDEYKGQLPFNQLLIILDTYKAQIAARYTNVVALWIEVHITSVFPPERVYEKMVQEHTDLDTLDQLMRRLSFIVYHWKEGDEYKQFEIPASEYRGYDALVARATAPPVEWVELPDDTPLPPQFTQRTGAQQGLTHDGELLPC